MLWRLEDETGSQKPESINHWAIPQGQLGQTIIDKVLCFLSQRFLRYQTKRCYHFASQKSKDAAFSIWGAVSPGSKKLPIRAHGSIELKATRQVVERRRQRALRFAGCTNFEVVSKTCEKWFQTVLISHPCYFVDLLRSTVNRRYILRQLFGWFSWKTGMRSHRQVIVGTFDPNVTSQAIRWPILGFDYIFQLQKQGLVLCFQPHLYVACQWVVIASKLKRSD